MALARSPFDVSGAVGETIELLRPLLRNHRLRWEHAGEPLVGVGDEARFRQVMEQLLENEAKYAPRGGGVSVGAWSQVGEIRVYVTDDGPGIPHGGVGDGLRGLRPQGAPARSRLGDRPVCGPPPAGGDGRPGLDRGKRVRWEPVRRRPARGRRALTMELEGGAR